MIPDTSCLRYAVLARLGIKTLDTGIRYQALVSRLDQRWCPDPEGGIRYLDTSITTEWDVIAECRATFSQDPTQGVAFFAQGGSVCGTVMDGRIQPEDGYQLDTRDPRL